MRSRTAAEIMTVLVITDGTARVGSTIPSKGSAKRYTLPNVFHIRTWPHACSYRGIRASSFIGTTRSNGARLPHKPTAGHSIWYIALY